MNLQTWVKSDRGRSIKLARAIDVPPSFVTKMVKGIKPVPAVHCKAIERFTGGEVTVQELCPDWQKIWPELTTQQPTQPAAAEVA